MARCTLQRYRWYCMYYPYGKDCWGLISSTLPYNHPLPESYLIPSFGWISTQAPLSNMGSSCTPQLMIGGWLMKNSERQTFLPISLTQCSIEQCRILSISDQISAFPSVSHSFSFIVLWSSCFLLLNCSCYFSGLLESWMCCLFEWSSSSCPHDQMSWKHCYYC